VIVCPARPTYASKLQLLNTASDLIASEPFNKPVPAQEDAANGGGKTAHMSGSTSLDGD
jgi:hypothetical protein